MYLFFSIDATDEASSTGSLGRLINHSRKAFNSRPVTFLMANPDPKIKKKTPYLYFEATRDIEVGEEILYDYGDHSAESHRLFPWLKT